MHAFSMDSTMNKASTYGLHTERVCINAVGERAAAIATFVCAALTPAADPTTLSLSLAGEGPFVLSHDSMHESSTTEAEAAAALMRAMTVKIISNYTHGIALRAVALESDAGVLLFLGLPLSGDSTLAMDFAARGLRFLSDELVFVPSGTIDACAWALPAQSKPDLRACAQLGGPRDAARRRPIKAIIALEYAPDASALISRLGVSETSTVLLSALLNGKNLDSVGVPAVAALARSVDGYRLRYGALDEAFLELMARAQSAGSFESNPAI